jgi:prepilin-type N-terminal cleavage/methylation domain-containing protein
MWRIMDAAPVALNLLNNRAGECGMFERRDKNMKKQGFTLVELMIVIAILGLIAVLSVPNIKGFLQTWKLNGETQELATTLRTARSAAVKRNIDVVFSFDINNDTYFYFEDSDGDGGHDNDEYMSATRELPPGIVITAHTLPTASLTFGSKGETGSSGTITLRNSRNNTKSIRIMGGSGNIEID